jgi:hypothetical protein
MMADKINDAHGLFAALYEAIEAGQVNSIPAGSAASYLSRPGADSAVFAVRIDRREYLITIDDNGAL